MIMTGPGPEDLSPLRCDPRATALPYALTWSDLAPCLPDHDGGPATAWVAHTKQGLHGGESSQILTLHYRDRAGHDRESVCFVKRDGPPRRGEVPRYRFLADHDVPVAVLLAAIERDDATVLVLEFLSVIGTRPDQADDLLALIASLNAVPKAPRDLFAPQPGMPQAEFDDLVARSLPADRRSDWLTAYRRAVERLARAPLALNHGELYFQQVGWSDAGAGHRLVLFDLETTALLPRFTDVARILDGLAAQTGRTDRELFDTYLGQLWSRSISTAADAMLNGSVRPSTAGLWEELLVTRLVSSFESLPWLTGQADADLPESAADMIDRIERDLRLLG